MKPLRAHVMQARKIVVVFAVLTVVVAGWPGRVPAVLAQGDGPLVTYYDAEVVFPAVIRLTITIDATPEALSGVSLALEQGNDELRSGDVDIEAAAFSIEPYTQLQVNWPLPLDGSVELFAPVSYRWTVETVDGTTVDVEGDLSLEPAGVEWRHTGDAPLRITTFDDDLNIGVARRAVLPAYTLLADLSGSDREFNWLVLPRNHQFCTMVDDEEGNPQSVVLSATGRESYPCDEADATRLFTVNGYRLLMRQRPGLLLFQNELIADMFDAMVGPYWAGQRIPAWFYDGLQQMTYVTVDAFALQQIREAARRDTLLPADQLDRVPEGDDAVFWKQQAYTMVLYLADTYGADAPFMLARDLRESDFTTAFEDVTGQNVEQFLVGWERWLFTDSAQQAIAWTVYQPDTPTPQPTVPTTTPSPTLTLTPTLTSTVTPSLVPSPTAGIVQVVTALPTFTPSPEAPALPTNTPRPPGSLDQPSGGGSNGGGGGSPACFSGLSVLLLPAAVLFTAQRRKRLP